MLLKDRKIVVTGGPTREWFDPFRFISNPSSGKMGIAIADESWNRSRETIFIHGPIASSLSDKPYRSVIIDSTSDLLNAVLDEVEDNSVLIMAAAPVDYTPVSKSAIKIKKSDKEFVIRLKRTPDILQNISQRRESGLFPGLFIVGFAAETTNIEKYAREKLTGKNIEMVCLNDISRKDSGFGTDTNLITIFKNNGRKVELPLLTKDEAAVKILEQVELELSKKL